MANIFSVSFDIDDRIDLPCEQSPLVFLLGTARSSLLTDVVVLTPSDEILPSAYPSCILNSATSTNQNLPSKFWKVTSVDLGAE